MNNAIRRFVTSGAGARFELSNRAPTAKAMGHPFALYFILQPSSFSLSGAKCRAPPKLVQGIEPWTSSLPRTRSTTELYQHARGANPRLDTSSAQRQRGRA